GMHEAEQHPDRGGLARAVRAQESVHAAWRHGEVDAIHRELTAAEPHREAARGNRRAGPLLIGGLGVRLGHLTLAASAYSTDGVTAPARISPLLVSSTDSRLVRSRRPEPHEPCTGFIA